MRSRRKSCGPMLVAVMLSALSTLPAAADTFVRFADGRHLQVRSYILHPQALELQIEAGMKIVLPLGAADLIEANGQEIALYHRLPSRGQSLESTEPVQLADSAPVAIPGTFSTGYLTTGIPQLHDTEPDRASIRAAGELLQQNPD